MDLFDITGITDAKKLTDFIVFFKVIRLMHQ
jgi:hypothetical protein